MIDTEYFLEHLKNLVYSRNFFVAYSGGLDSHVLLHLLTQYRQRDPEISLTAIHVHHGLSPNADSWQQHCEKICAELNAPLITRKISISKQPQLSLEAQARETRYQIFAGILPEQACLLTAHTQNDQAETLLLQLMRGAGVKGLAAMPTKKIFSQGWLVRPLLNYARADLEDYAKQQQLKWIDDESNYTLSFDRNFMRLKVLPLLQQRWPQLLKTLNRSSEHCAEASELLAEFADKDLELVWDKKNNRLNLKPFMHYSAARQRNILRRWLSLTHRDVPSMKQLQRIMHDVMYSSDDAQALFQWHQWEIRRYHDYLYLISVQEPFNSQQILAWDLNQPLKLPRNIGVLTAAKQRGQGIRETSLQGQVTIRFRQGGEKIQPPGRSTHCLKKLMQEWEIPPWQREQVPLLYVDEQLIAVVGYCIAAQAVALENEMGWVINAS